MSSEAQLLGEIRGKLDLMHEEAGRNFSNLFSRTRKIESNTAVMKSVIESHESRLKRVELTIGKAIVIAASLIGGVLGVPKLVEAFFK